MITFILNKHNRLDSNLYPTPADEQTHGSAQLHLADTFIQSNLQTIKAAKHLSEGDS